MPCTSIVSATGSGSPRSGRTSARRARAAAPPISRRRVPARAASHGKAHMIGTSTTAPMAHAAPTSSPGAPMSSMWIEKKPLIAIDADHTTKAASRKRPQLPADAARADALQPRQWRDARSAAAQEQPHDARGGKQRDVHEEQARDAGALDHEAGQPHDHHERRWSPTPAAGRSRRARRSPSRARGHP